MSKTTTIKSSELRPGDLIKTYGCTVKINEVKSRADTEQGMPVFWSVATVIDNPPNGIPRSYLDKAEDGSLTWRIQGNDRATWAKVETAKEADA
jgi:hypothetical protein